MRAYDLTVTGSAVVSGSVTASYFKGDGTGITGVTAEWDGTHTGDGNITGVLTFGSLTDGSITIADFKDQDNLSSDSATSLATQQSIKAYVDAQVTAEDLDVTSDSGTIAIDLDSETLSIAGGTGITTSATGNEVTITSAITAGDGLTLNTADIDIDAAQTTITSLFATDIKIGEDNETRIDFGTANQIHFYAGNQRQLEIADGSFAPTSDSDVDLGSTGVRWKDAFVDSLTSTGTVSGSLGKFTSATIVGGTITGITDLAVADGGTGASTLNDLITLGTHTTGNYVGTLTGGLGITSSGATSGEGIAHSISVDSAPISGSWRGYITGSGIVSASSIASSAQGQVALTTNGVAASAVDLGLQTGDSPQFTAVNIGHASDTTITRPSAGDISVEGNIVYRAGGTDVPVTDGGTGASSLNDLITLTTHTTGNYVGTLTGGLGITSTGATSGEGIAHSISVDSVPISGSWRGWASGSSNHYFGGNVGIGTTSPDEALSVVGNISGSASLLIGSNITQTGTSNQLDINPYRWVRFGRSTNNANFALGVWKGDGNDVQNHKLTGNGDSYLSGNNGNVGIGTLSPSEKLHVEGDALVTGMLTAREFHTQFVSASIIYQSGSTQFGDTTDDMHSFTGSLQVSGSTLGKESYIIGTNVGIGTTNPTAVLDIATTADYSQDFKIRNDDVTMRMYASSAGVFQFLQTTNNDMIFGTNDTERVRIDNAGLVGIGTNNPEHLLHVEGDNKAIELHSADYSLVRIGSAGSAGASLDQGVVLIREDGVNKTHVTTTGISGSSSSTGSFGQLRISNTTDAPMAKLVVGTTAPSAGSSVVAQFDGSIRTENYVIMHDSSNNSNAIGWYYNANNMMELMSEGSGTTNLYIPGNISGSVTSTGSFGDIILGGNHGSADGDVSNLRVYNSGNEVAKIRFKRGADAGDGEIEFFTANDSLNSVAMHIDQNSKVGIGTTTPGQKLEIGSSNDTSVLRLKETTGQDSIWDLRAAANNSFHISGSTDGSTTTAMFTILDTGKVGIGTDNPGFDLDVQDATANLQVKSTTGANIAYANFCNTGGNVYVGQDNSGGGGLAVGSLAYAAIFGHVGAHPIQFITNETPRMTILHSSGNVGIGTNAPVTTLDVHSAGTEVASVWGMADDGTVWVATRTAETQNNYGAYAFMVGSVAVDGVGSPNTTAYIASKVLNSGGTLKGDLGFYTNAGDSLGTAKMLIDETGKIGIGTTAPAKTLTVEGDISGSAKLHVGPNPANQNGLSVTGNNQIGTFVSTDDHKVSIALGLPGDTQLFYLGSRASLAGTGTDHTVGLYADINGNGSVGLDFYTGGTATGNCRMAIAAGGNVGIGTTNPDRLLHLHTGTAGSITGNVNAPLVVETAGDANIQLLAPNTSDEYILFGSNSGNRTYIQVDLSATAANESFQIYTNSALAFKLDANSRISLSNNDGNTSNTVFGYKALTNNGTVLGDVGADNNTAIGHLAMGTGTTTTAIQNTAVGYDALTDLTTGNRNCAFGMNALMNLTSGQTEGNVAIGYGAADALETGDGNVVIGSAALDASHAATSNCVIIGARAGDAISATSADGTVAVGRSSLGALTIGAKNTALGYEALNAMQEGGGNVALGYQALKGANHADADNNIAIGSNTMDGIGGNGAAWNVGIGADALGGALTGDFNIAIGQAAGLTVAAGAKNVMIGHDAGATITTGDENVAIGEGAMNGGVVVGDQNVAIGANSGDALTSGTRNIFVGAGSGGSMAGGTDCVAIGHLALTGATSGYQDSCIAIGSYALRVQSGNVYAKNMAIGHGAMSGSTQMTNTVAIGYAALGNAVDGDYNVVLGNQAMGLGGGSKNPSHNVAIGYAAMKNYNQNGDGNNCVVGDEVAGSLTTGVNNTLIGTAANAHAAGGTNQTVIGKGAVGHADNIVVLGNTDVTGWHPADDNGVDLGSASYRFANLYVGDMQMNNEGTGGNEVDGTEGNWSLQEGEDDLFVINRKTGKKFKIKLEEM